MYNISHIFIQRGSKVVINLVFLHGIKITIKTNNAFVKCCFLED